MAASGFLLSNSLCLLTACSIGSTAGREACSAGLVPLIVTFGHEASGSVWVKGSGEAVSLPIIGAGVSHGRYSRTTTLCVVPPFDILVETRPELFVFSVDPNGNPSIELTAEGVHPNKARIDTRSDCASSKNPAADGEFDYVYGAGMLESPDSLKNFDDPCNSR